MADALIVKECDSAFAGEISPLAMRAGFSVRILRNLHDVEQYLDRECPAVVFLDMEILKGKRINLLRSASKLKKIDFILLTHRTTMDHSLRALHVSGPESRIEAVGEAQLYDILARVRRQARGESECDRCLEDFESCGCFGALCGRSPSMRHVYEQIASVAPTAMTVLVFGESGTGKELVAQTIHELSPRRRRSFIPVNCGAISPQLVESEMFGHEKGSFTGANALHRGFFEQANEGTLFLDEVTEMSRELQVKFLRVLETGNFMRIGSSQLHHTDVRIVAATNVLPEKAVASDRLREDLFYRLNVFPIYLPPLRERRDDIPLLAEHFLEIVCAREGQRKRFSPEALLQMGEYAWPGNVRELRNAIQRGFVLSRGDEISGEWFPRGGALDAGEAATQHGTPLLAEIERSAILATLERFDGHRERAAAALGISPKTLYNRLKQYAVETDNNKQG